MDHSNGNIAGPFNAGLSLFGSIIAWISIKDVQVFVAICASCVAIVSGCFAIKYYHKQLKK